MILQLEPDAEASTIHDLRQDLESCGARTFGISCSPGHQILVYGETDAARELAVARGLLTGGEPVPPNPLTLRASSTHQTEVNLEGRQRCRIGSTDVVVIAGPCAVEDRDVLLATARGVLDAGAGALRGGAYKPRTSPYSFQGLGERGLALLGEARSQFGIPVVTEVLDLRLLEPVLEVADMIQIGARSMQNYPLLDEVGRVQRPVLLKRGLSATIDEFLFAAERIMLKGNHNVVLCERGIRAFGQATRNTLDVGAVPLLKERTHLPVLVDPSHAAGRRDLVTPMAAAAIAAGADGLIVEVHPEPASAWVDGAQSLSLDGLQDLTSIVGRVAEAVGRSLWSAAASHPARPHPKVV